MVRPVTLLRIAVVGEMVFVVVLMMMAVALVFMGGRRLRLIDTVVVARLYQRGYGDSCKNSQQNQP